MHREPLPRDIIRVPGSDAPERVVSVDDRTLTLAPLRGDGERTIERPARGGIALVGVAAPGRRRRAVPPPDAAKHMAQVIPVPDNATVAHTHVVVSAQDAAQILQDPGAEISCGYGSGGIDPSDLF